MYVKNPTLFSFFFIISSVFFLSNCRKNSEEEFNEYYGNNYADSLCFNNIMDENEKGTDCGGLCTPCPDFNVSCEIPENTYDIEAFTPRSVAYTTIDSSNSSWVFFAHESESDYMTFKFSEKPNLSLSQEMVSFVDEPFEVEVDWVLESGTVLSCTGTLYVFFTDGHYVFKSCNFSVKVNSFDTASADLNITF